MKVERAGEHARVGEGINEMHAVLLQAREPWHIPPGPARREVLNLALLIGQEDEHVHAVDPVAVPGQAAARLRHRRRCARCPAEQDSRRCDSNGLQ